MGQERIKRVYVVPFQGKEHLVRAVTYRSAANLLLTAMLKELVKNTRVATQDDLIRLVGSGQEVIEDAAGVPTPTLGADGHIDDGSSREREAGAGS